LKNSEFVTWQNPATAPSDKRANLQFIKPGSFCSNLCRE